jgi:hypothetical protein
MQQIAEWLKTLGMSEYAERFAANDTDTSVLRHLTDQDLRELCWNYARRRTANKARQARCGAGLGGRPSLHAWLGLLLWSRGSGYQPAASPE